MTHNAIDNNILSHLLIKNKYLNCTMEEKEQLFLKIYREKNYILCLSAYNYLINDPQCSDFTKAKLSIYISDLFLKTFGNTKNFEDIFPLNLNIFKIYKAIIIDYNSKNKSDIKELTKLVVANFFYYNIECKLDFEDFIEKYYNPLLKSLEFSKARILSQYDNNYYLTRSELNNENNELNNFIIDNLFTKVKNGKFFKESYNYDLAIKFYKNLLMNFQFNYKESIDNINNEIANLSCEKINYKFDKQGFDDLINIFISFHKNYNYDGLYSICNKILRLENIGKDVKNMIIDNFVDISNDFYLKENENKSFNVYKFLEIYKNIFNSDEVDKLSKDKIARNVFDVFSKNTENNIYMECNWYHLILNNIEIINEETTLSIANKLVNLYEQNTSSCDLYIDTCNPESLYEEYSKSNENQYNRIKNGKISEIKEIVERIKLNKNSNGSSKNMNLSR